MSLPPSSRGGSDPPAIEDIYEGSDWAATPGQGLGPPLGEEPWAPLWQDPPITAAEEGGTLDVPFFEALGVEPLQAIGDLTPRPSPSSRLGVGHGQRDQSPLDLSDGGEGSVSQGISSQPHI